MSAEDHWICQRWKDDSPRDDVWFLRERRPTVKPQLQTRLLNREYRCGTTKRFRTSDGVFEIFSAEDALVL